MTWVLTLLVFTAGGYEPQELGRFETRDDCHRAMAHAHVVRLYEPMRDGHGRLLKCLER